MQANSFGENCWSPQPLGLSDSPDLETRHRASLSSEDPKVRVMARRASSMPAPPEVKRW